MSAISIASIRKSSPSLRMKSKIIKDFWGVVVECKVMPRAFDRKTFRFKTEYIHSIY